MSGWQKPRERPGDRARRDDRARRAPGPKPEAPEHGGRLVTGQHAVRELIRAHGLRVFEVLVEHDPRDRAAALARFASDSGIPLRSVPRAELDALSGGGLHQGVAAYGPDLTFTAPEDLLKQPNLLAVALDGVVDPQNFGAVIRSAVGLTDAAIVFAESSAAPLTPATFRASAGAIEHAALCRVPSLHAFLAQAAEAGAQVVGLEPQAEAQLHELELAGPLVVVIGSEEKGMHRAVRRSCTSLVRLASGSRIQSLNASVAAGIALHQVLVARLRARG